MKKKETKIASLSAKTTLGNSVCNVNTLICGSDSADITGSGTIGFGMNANLKAQMLLSKEFTQMLLAAEPERKSQAAYKTLYKICLAAAVPDREIQERRKPILLNYFNFWRKFYNKGVYLTIYIICHKKFLLTVAVFLLLGKDFFVVQESRDISYFPRP